MKFEWDDNKNRANIVKHGIDFEQAQTIFNDPFLLVFFDERQEYNELREIAIGRMPLVTQGTSIIVIVVYTERNGITRLISARKANKSERRRYEQGKLFP